MNDIEACLELGLIAPLDQVQTVAVLPAVFGLLNISYFFPY